MLSPLRTLELLLIAALFSCASFAATPTSGSVTPTTGSKTAWTSSAFGATNGESTCVEGTTCDSFTLTITGAASSYNNKYVNISIAWSLSTNDYDLYIHKGSLTGPVVASSTGGVPQTGEGVSLSPTSLGVGVYVVHVVASTTVPGDSPKGTAVVATAPITPPPPNVTPPTYRNYQSPTGIGDNSGEPSIGDNWNTGRVMTSAVLDTLRVSFNTAVSPATATWVVKNSPLTSITSLDPILFTDRKTGRTFVSQLAGTTSLSEFTDDDGTTYTPSQGAGIASGVDHQTIGGGPFRVCNAQQKSQNPTYCATLTARGPLTSYANAVYYASQDIGLAQMALSQDGGLTYEAAHPMYTLAQCGGLHGHIRVAGDGTVYVPNKNCGGTQGLVSSKDNGLTFTVYKVTGSTPGSSDPSVGIGSKGRVYFGYTDANNHPWIATSDDGGQSWHNNQDLATRLGIKNAVFPEVVAGDNDRATFFFLGTKSAGPGTGDDTTTIFDGVWHAYFASTYNGGQNWVVVDATPSDPVQLGVVCTNGTTCPSGTRNLLDFNDVTIDWHGRVLAAYTDGCITAKCIADGNNSTAQHTKAQNDGTTKASIIREATGLSLFQKYDSTPLKP
ncbi:hypothetical protein Acid345_0197 [Candidatus Koribacter versatilis Ellin345]|uniref:Exo-alpha-sialidase n=1 Tax=Koribacter versatilis (strain Ellin345) TaxID=204669 RepID=Q1IV98_KORVE|nr:hypothetical protein Acid345_0197 [Candidatus Koribacter versatilis Ellin345]